MSQRDAEFTAFVAARGGALMRYSYVLTGSASAAEDLLQTTLLRVYVSWPRITDTSNERIVESYARTTMTRLNISWWRRGLRLREVPAATTPEPPTTETESGPDAQLWEALADLGPRQRAVVVLRFYEGLSEPEIAHAMGCSRGTVKSQLSRALDRLRRDLTDEAGRPSRPRSSPAGREEAL